MPYLFSYGSNHPGQLSERIGYMPPSRAAYLSGFKRVFRGFSRNWGGGVASLEKRAGATVFGYVSQVTSDDLKTLDRYEGVASGNYKRTTVTLHDGTRAVAYVSTSRTFAPPTEAYLKACAKTVGAFWKGARGQVTWKNFDIS